MRSRKKILEEFEDTHSYDPKGLSKLFLEVLLDNRGLLEDIRGLLQHLVEEKTEVTGSEEAPWFHRGGLVSGNDKSEFPPFLQPCAGIPITPKVQKMLEAVADGYRVPDLRTEVVNAPAPHPSYDYELDGAHYSNHETVLEGHEILERRSPPPDPGTQLYLERPGQPERIDESTVVSFDPRGTFKFFTVPPVDFGAGTSIPSRIVLAMVDWFRKHRDPKHPAVPYALEHTKKWGYQVEWNGLTEDWVFQKITPKKYPMNCPKCQTKVSVDRDDRGAYCLNDACDWMEVEVQ